MTERCEQELPVGGEQRVRCTPNWTAEEISTLEMWWGVHSIASIAKHLNRSVEGVKLKAQRIGLSDNRKCLDGITLLPLAKELHISYATVRGWIDSHDFPARRKVLSQTMPVFMVRYADFWNWAYLHRPLVDFSRLEVHSLGPEPAWVQEKRKLDSQSFDRRSIPWTAQQDATLKKMIDAYRYTYPQISAALKRSEAAIKRRVYDLGIKGRPLRLENHIKYNAQEVETIERLYRQGCSWNGIAERLGRSALGIRGKLERMGYTFGKEAVKK
ncbi:MAG: hypothetical protein ACYCYO_02130 [Bacilli bacterium]